MFAYDLETCFIKSGFKRNITRILEIGFHGIVDSKHKKYNKMINPCSKFDSGKEIISELNKMDQDPEKTIHFWTKLLIEKGALKTNIKRSSTEIKAGHISTLLKRSSIAFEESDDKHTPEKWLFALENFDDDIKKAKEFLNSKKTEKPKSLLFYPLNGVLNQVINEFGDYIWIAHNGKAFDQKIIEGNCQRLSIDVSCIQFEDSIPVFKRLCKDEPSYSLPILYKSIMKSSYKAHHAYEDAKALYELFAKVTDGMKEEEIFVKKSDLLLLNGVGKKTVEKLNKKNIFTQAQLYDYVDTHTIENWNKDFSDLYRYKALGKSLFSTASV